MLIGVGRMRHPREMANDRIVPWCAAKFGRYSDLLGWFVDTA